MNLSPIVFILRYCGVAVILAYCMSTYRWHDFGTRA